MNNNGLKKELLKKINTDINFYRNYIPNDLSLFEKILISYSFDYVLRICPNISNLINKLEDTYSYSTFDKEILATIIMIINNNYNIFEFNEEKIKKFVDGLIIELKENIKQRDLSSTESLEKDNYLGIAYEVMILKIFCENFNVKKYFNNEKEI